MPDEIARVPCPMCGELIAAKARKCRFCGETVSDESLPEEKDDAPMSRVIPYKNPPALIGYYLGIFSLFPCFPIGIAAFVLGIIGWRRVLKNPELHGSVHAWIGIILGGLFGLLWLIFTGFVIFGAMMANQRR